ncbi:TIGR03943 family protein [Geitlerinema sp. PCC 9228]|jgi:uncharacterized repeat protein (TIGR03943 family)|uniref:TIGR03943 family putative permease subunit n=1 Tax=Geitlerinema sp. PCC 9228 TaxID=111611 RepID=UPI0008F9D017|nr:TIGR03943 family protein [Geitlerinema sp. PCC 9228]
MRTPASPSWLRWLDVLAIGAWGVLLLKYWLTGKLLLLIHPNYIGLCVGAGILLLFVAGWKAWQLYHNSSPLPSVAPHTTLFPNGWSQGLLLAAAIAGLLVTPRPFSSDRALTQNITELSAVNRSSPESFQIPDNPEQRSLVGWIRTLNVYPEPEAYTGQKVDVTGFVIHSPQVNQRTIVVSRFIITCCAADAYPVGLPVQIDKDRSNYPPDTWIRVKGKAISMVLDGNRQLGILADSIEKIPEPKNPYDY